MTRSRCILALCAFLLACLGAAHAADGVPTSESVRELLTVMQSRQLVDSTLVRADESLRTTLAQMVVGQPSAEEQAILDDLRSQSISILREAMQWQTLEPRFIEIYQASFTQGEVDGMLEFYRSDAGRAVIARMPGAMQRTMLVMQELVNGMMPRLRELQNDALERLKAAQEKKPGG
jgi:hypothetical protein